MRRGRRNREATLLEGSSLPLSRMLDTPLHRSLGETSASPSKGVVDTSIRRSHPSRDNLVETLPSLKHNFYRIDDEGTHHLAILRGDDILEEAVQHEIGGLKLPKVMLHPLVELPHAELHAIIQQSRGLVSLIVKHAAFVSCKFTFL